MKLLVIVADYPDNDNKFSLMFVHTRNLLYLSQGIEVTVLNYKAKEFYEIDGIEVHSVQSFEDNYKKMLNYFDVLVFHAPNIRNHYKFLTKYNTKNIPLAFVFHGHEVMKIVEQYPSPYAFRKQKNLITTLFQRIYDRLKISVWRNFFLKTNSKFTLIFVSEWMKEVFFENLKVNMKFPSDSIHVIANSVGELWEKNHYNIAKRKEYNFITIRSNLDDSKYAIDLVTKWANKNPNLSFLLIGRGTYFDHINKPTNLEWISDSLPHNALMDYVDSSECALMPTRLDAQGLMSCELATYGIPLITSDIDVCRMVFSDFPNVYLISNDSNGSELGKVKDVLQRDYSFDKDDRFFAEKTIKQEIDVFQNLISQVRSLD